MPYALKPGFIWNPWRNHGRNEPCPCKSGKKFKKCHLPRMPIAIDLNKLPPNLKKEEDAPAKAEGA